MFKRNFGSLIINIMYRNLMQKMGLFIVHIDTPHHVLKTHIDVF